MEKIGLFYGSDTGCTDDITKDIVSLWQSEELEVLEISDATPKHFEKYEVLILGLSTWYDGDLQSDWETFFNDFKKIDFSNKIVALYGLGDQIGYSEYFVDGIGILARVILKNGGEIIGHWPVKGYNFRESLAVIESKEDFFYGLVIDNDNQSQLTDSRLNEWIGHVKTEIDLWHKEREIKLSI